jgi:hypothetical protein
MMCLQGRRVARQGLKQQKTAQTGTVPSQTPTTNRQPPISLETNLLDQLLFKTFAENTRISHLAALLSIFYPFDPNPLRSGFTKSQRSHWLAKATLQ